MKHYVIVGEIAPVAPHLVDLRFACNGKFDACANGIAVSARAFETKRDPVIPVPAFIAVPKEIRKACLQADQPSAALIQDLKERGLLDETLVIWAGEFGRTVYSQGKLTADDYGRDHHPRAWTIWLAGGGIKPGITIGETDDYGYNITEDRFTFTI